jgi:hypothetical protein
MAVGAAAAAYMRNLPPAGSYVVSPKDFMERTERNDMPLTPITFPGFGSFADLRINNVGIIAGIELVFEGTLTSVGAANIAPGHKWPYGMLREVAISVNGQSNLIAVDGQDLKARELRITRNYNDAVAVTPVTAAAVPFNAAGSASVIVTWRIPIAHDERVLLGAIFAQSDESYLNMRLSTANQPAAADGDLFDYTAGTSIALTGSFYPTLTFYEIPQVSDGQRNLIVVPDLSQLHGMAVINSPVAQNGEFAQNLLRTTGALTCLYHRVDNGTYSTINLHVATTVTGYKLTYGGNQTPREFQHAALSWKNARDYDGLIAPVSPSGFPVRYLLLDLEVENPMRDVILPKGVTDLQTRMTFSGVTWTNGLLHTVQETLFQAT